MSFPSDFWRGNVGRWKTSMNSCKTQNHFWRSENFFQTHKKLDFFLQFFQKENVFAYNSQHFSVDLPPKAATLVTTVQNYTVQEKKLNFRKNQSWKILKLTTCFSRSEIFLQTDFKNYIFDCSRFRKKSIVECNLQKFSKFTAEGGHAADNCSKMKLFKKQKTRKSR